MNTIIYKGKTCYIERMDFIKIKVELGFGVSVVQNFRLANLETPKSKKARGDLKGCLIILLGGHSVVMKDVDVSSSTTVYATHLFIPCSKPPPGAETFRFRDKVWMDVGTYINWFRRQHNSDEEINPAVLRQDYIT